jgi:spore maturation protein CgeB
VTYKSILYLGQRGGTSGHRAAALGRLGHKVFVLDPRKFVPAGPVIDKWIFETGGMFLADYVRRRVISAVAGAQFNLVYVDGGALIGPELVQELKIRFGTIINYNIDDPYGGRDRKKWRLYLRALPFYDLAVVVRDCNLPEARETGARKVIRVRMSCDEVAHMPRMITPSDHQNYDSEVSFVGTWMPERGPFLARLIDLGVPLSIYGDRWQKAREWPVLESRWRGPGIHDDNKYALVIQCSRVCLGLLSKGNRDLSTTRSYEIPYLSAVLCAERTTEHSLLYREDEEAVFWSSPEECARKCFWLLGDDKVRAQIARNGRERCIRNGFMNERVVSEILCAAVPELSNQSVTAGAI